jgi:GNAT superfamily N-acetyltransferase
VLPVIADDTIRSRAFDPANDILQLGDFIASTTAQCSAYAFGHPGNLWWSMFYSTNVDPVRSARLWEDADGDLLGLAWLDGGELVMHVHPRLRGSGLIEDHMLAWAEGQVRVLGADDAAELFTSADPDDAAYIALLQRHGYHQQPDPLVLLELDLAHPVPDSPITDAVTVRHVAHPDDFTARVDVHRDAFAPSSFSLESYQRLRMAPGYIPELDLVAVLRDGSFGSSCICWWDSVSQRGLFEPVGTRAAFQRRGLARAVMLEGLRRLRAYGARTAAVGTAAGHSAAIRLYEDVGMRVVKQSYTYSKLVSSLA